MIGKRFTIGEIGEFEGAEGEFDASSVVGFEYEIKDVLQLRNALRERPGINIHSIEINSREYERILLERLSEYGLENKPIRAAFLEGKSIPFQLCIKNSVEYLPLYMFTGDIDDAGERVEHKVLTGYISCDRFSPDDFVSLEKTIRDYATKRKETANRLEYTSKSENLHNGILAVSY